ncbi:methyltransferase small domain-containing protein [Paracoccidioides lutzii Pb01]|uniref:Methyltransferase small domain-containing protein n=1 Tax=Paracoccidioides lutzii (strain ATCC MYA-826 / Pb01) TaxID=502779 RepID=C1GPR9_PARBA|nr:methyltransferase small domain-containing protein [Paracoccidioides lutzii Pb01]EEH36191.2 methyltransferase small domain-containing protein [Paracoccidioides lutzii Pb01]
MAGNPTPYASPPTSTADVRKIKYMNTIDAYDQWAKASAFYLVYDTDGNFLQALDTLQMQSLLPKFISLLPKINSNTTTSAPKLIDLGCGTGRNTIPLLRAAPTDATIIGLDPSSKMLQIAQDKVSAYLARVADIPPAGVVDKQRDAGPEDEGRVSFQIFNLLDFNCAAEGAGGVTGPADSDGVISTLVVEHVPVDKFFRAAAGMLKRGGVLLVTNMHSEMGRISQAGFVDPVTGVKIRPTSFAHTVAEIVEAAERVGFEVEGDIKEVRVNEELAGRLGPRAQKWIDVQVWYGGCFRKR